MNRSMALLRRRDFWAPLLLATALATPLTADPATAPHSGWPLPTFVEHFCSDCHAGDDPAANLALVAASARPVNEHRQLWEKVVRKLVHRQMPPADALRPDEALYDAVVSSLVDQLDAAAARNPRPRRTDTFRRLTRTEYQNAIRDLLALDIDAESLLPKDESSGGFDNLTVGDLSPALLERYVLAAEKISRLAVGGVAPAPEADTFRVRPDLTQEDHVVGLPLGTRGGLAVPYHFPRDGEYEVQVRLARDRDEYVEGLHEPHEMDVLLDRELIKRFTIASPAEGSDHHTVDAHLKVRFRAPAGPHQLGVTFLKQSTSLLETRRQPYEAHFNRHRHPRLSPAVYEVSITGPHSTDGPGDTPSRRRIFVCQPSDAADEPMCARQILASLARRAYRRPVNDADLAGPLEFFRQAREDGDFEAGIQAAVASILVSPQFLFRIEPDPPDVPPGTAYAIDSLQLASRLSFFLWSSIPDDELLAAAERGELGQPEVLESQVQRMLADARSDALVTNFAAQWLHLRNLEAAAPDLRLFPDFDDNLRQAFRQETEMLVMRVMREDRSVVDLLQSDTLFVNERLAKHYEIPHVYGSRFREIPVGDSLHRGGLLRQGSILTVTSYATRTSPVIRGKWILENLLGTSVPPPPRDVPALAENPVDASLTVRQRLAEHRNHAACAGCHSQIDPLGFALEHYDAVGRWRAQEAEFPIDASGTLPDGTELSGAADLEQILIDRPEIFVGALAKKLLTFALGRPLTDDDAPAVRRIVREARDGHFRFSSIILGVVKSTPFQMRTSS